MRVERIIEVRGNIGLLIERKIVKAVDMESLKSALMSADVRTPILPPNIFYQKSEDKTTIAMVRDQGIKEVQFLNEPPVRIFLPVRVYFIHSRDNVIGKIQQFFSKKIPCKESDVLWHAPFANRYEDGSICDAGLNLMNISTPIAERLDSIIEQIEATRYNNDLAAIGVSLAPHEITSLMGPSTNFKHMLLGWAAMTVEKSVEEILNLSWQSAGRFGDYLDGYRRRTR